MSNVDAAWKPDRHQMLQRLRTLVRRTDLLHHRHLSACGPAVFFWVWQARDLIAEADFASALLRDCSAAIGSLSDAPKWKLLGQDYAALRAATNDSDPDATQESADWMLLTGPRDSEPVLFNYVGEPFTLADKLDEITLLGTLAGWLSATNGYSSVENDTPVMVVSDRQKLWQLISTSNVDIVLFVSATAISPLYPAPPATPAPGLNALSYPDHICADDRSVRTMERSCLD